MLKKERLYRIWSSMKTRCYNKNREVYRLYGGRGITVCAEWKNDYKEFFHWAITNGYKDGLTLDRIDNNKGYSPENCRWVTMAEQGRNTRRNVWIEYNGKRMVLSDWAKEIGITISPLRERIQRYGVEVALSMQKGRQLGLAIEYNGVTKSLAAWAEVLDLSPQALRGRIKKYGIEKAFTMPKQEQFVRCKQNKVQNGQPATEEELLIEEVLFLAGKLSEARIMPSWKMCHDCTAYSYEACRTCWVEASANAMREGRHSK